MPMFDIYAGTEDNLQYQGKFRFDNFSQAEEYAFYCAEKERHTEEDNIAWYVEDEVKE